MGFPVLAVFVWVQEGQLIGAWHKIINHIFFAHKNKKCCKGVPYWAYGHHRGGSISGPSFLEQERRDTLYEQVPSGRLEPAIHLIFHVMVYSHIYVERLT